MTLRLTEKVECLCTYFWLPNYYLALVILITQINISLRAFDFIT